ncbi:MAG: potassium channel protein [Anaerolineaceae bacterium]|nr:MAG: potassium channel protein [Anaerolineaceae bacterium]
MPNLEGWGRRDALYMTIITVTTVGYGDLSPQTENGRTVAIFFTLFAIGIAGYAISSFAAYLIESRAARKVRFLRRRRMKRIDALHNHYILCGADLVGLRIAEEFQLSNVPYIIIEPDEEKLKTALLYSHPDYFQQKVQSFVDFDDIDLSEYEERTVAELADMLNTPYILDNPIDDAALVKAGIGRAVGLIAAMPDERDNLSIVVGARALAKRNDNEKLRIMARVENSHHARKMYLAGADFVRVPALSTGLEMAMHMMHPELGNWWYTMMGVDRASAPQQFHQIELSSKADWVDKTVADLHRLEQVITLAVKRDGEFISPPPAELALQSTDILITLSSKDGV